MLDTETKQRINSARQILVGKVPDPKAQVEQITTALIYKFMDDMDRENEDLGGKATFFTGILKEFAWGKLMSRANSGEQRWDLYTRALVEFSKARHVPELFRTIFKGAFLPYRDSETLNLFLKEIAGFSYSNSENLGNAFEYLLSILGSQGDAGQFRTPRHIIDFIVEVVNPDKTAKILDPACGTAGFLISAFKHIQRVNSSNFKPDKYIPGFAQTQSADMATVEIQSNGKYRGDKLTPDDRKRLTRNVVGYDISPDMVRLSLVNMYLHDFPTPEIFEYDSLTYEERWGDNFDVILANPPFMTPKGGIRPHSKFQVRANRAEVLFVDYIAEHLTINGKAGIIVPEGIIFQSSNAYKALRKMLVGDNYLWAVASLPAGVFQPYSGVKTSILFLDKQVAKKSDEILFVKIENDGFDLGAQRRRIDKNDLPEAYKVLQEGLKGKYVVSEKANWVQKTEIAESGEFNLTGERYREAADYSKVKWPMMKLGDIIKIESGSRQKGGALKQGIPSIGGEQIESTGAIKKQKMKYITEQHFQIMKKGILKTGDVLVVKDGATTGKVGFYHGNYKKAAVNEHVYIFRCDKNILPIFLYNVIRSQLFQQELKYYIKGIIGGISLDIKQIQIPLPPIHIQEGIVAELESYQRVIDGARQIVANWKKMIKVDPDWKVVELREVLDGKPKNGYSGRPVTYETKNKVLTLSATTFGNLDSKHFKYLDENIPERAEYRCKNGDIYLQRGNTKELVGTAALFNLDTTDFIYPDLMIRVRANENKILTKYLLHVLQSFTVRKFITSNAVGTAGSMPKINQNVVLRIPTPLPAIETQKKIVAEIEKEQKAIDEVKKLTVIHEQKIKDKIAEVWGE